MKHGIYIASKTKHAERWRQLRASGVPIISTWIDEAEQGQTADYADLWTRCISEAKSAERVVLYAEQFDILKGALVEIGAALANGVPVYIVGDSPSISSFTSHPLVTRVGTLEGALP